MSEKNTLSNWSLWAQGVRIPGAHEYTPPDLKITRVDIRTGGMDIATPTDGGMEPLTATFKIYGIDASVLGLLGMQAGQKMSRLTAYEGYIAPGRVIGRTDEIEGIVTGITPDARPNSNHAEAGFQIEVAVSYYRSVLDGRELYEIIPEQFVRRINGLNVLAEMASAIRI
ncbi:TPA: phage major tail tube protein [Klebsiella variicola]|uniref:phage major tail tube protein n=1 Tax=Klebsiella quasipneumoniae TaxID=1463165 RepID=UPI002B0E75F9|nr:phage major tail tube protein [Klebsiella variicola]